LSDATDTPERKPKPRNLFVVPSVADNASSGKPAKPVRLPRICRDLTKASSWLHEMGSIYRLARRGVLHPEVASRLAFIASNAGKLAASVEELREMTSMRQALDKLQNGYQPQLGAGSADEEATHE
jgi:hypothetical protein